MSLPEKGTRVNKKVQERRHEPWSMYSSRDDYSDMSETELSDMNREMDETTSLVYGIRGNKMFKKGYCFSKDCLRDWVTWDNFKVQEICSVIVLPNSGFVLLLGYCGGQYCVLFCV
jgi:hypothetical protein